MYGTTRPIVKRAILDGLAERLGATDVSLRYQPPETAQDLVNDDGALDAVWIDEPDTPDIELDLNMRALPHQTDEEYDVLIVVQTIRPESDGSQEACDLRAAEILYEVKGMLQSNPIIVGPTGNFPFCEITPGGVLPIVAPVKAGHGTRYEQIVHVKARIAAI